MSLGFGLVLPAAIAYAIGYLRQKRRLAQWKSSDVT
jgi:hypothetical protein